MNKLYWFYLDSYVHAAAIDGNVLLYNPYTSNILEYKRDGGNEAVFKLTKQLLSPRNNRVVLLKEHVLKKNGISQFVETIRLYLMGDLLDASFSLGKPFQMAPCVKIQKDVKYLKIDDIRSVGEEMMEYLEEITFYLNDFCGQSCIDCHNYYRQGICCTSNPGGKHYLDIKRLKSLFAEIQGCKLERVNITGGDIFSYPNWDELLPLLNSFTGKTIFYSHYSNTATHAAQLERLHIEGSSLKLLINQPLDEHALNVALDAAAKIGLNTQLVYIFQDKKEYDLFEDLNSRLNFISPEYFIFFNGANLNFFKENYFIAREDIEANKPNLKFIYINEKVNGDHFGRLTILANGRILANVNSNALGFIGKNSLHECVFKEMKDGRSWRKIRKHVKPCKSCVYRQLCPPINDYNFAIGRYNLCHINPVSEP